MGCRNAIPWSFECFEAGTDCMQVHKRRHVNLGIPPRILAARGAPPHALGAPSASSLRPDSRSAETRPIHSLRLARPRFHFEPVKMRVHQRHTLGVRAYKRHAACGDTRSWPTMRHFALWAGQAVVGWAQVGKDARPPSNLKDMMASLTFLRQRNVAIELQRWPREVLPRMPSDN